MQQACTHFDLAGLRLLRIRFLLWLIVLIRLGIGVIIAFFITVATMETSLRDNYVFFRNSRGCHSHWFRFRNLRFSNLSLLLLFKDLGVKIFIARVDEHLLRHI